MAPWIIPALKAVLPHVGTIVSAAQPMFSKTRTSSGVADADLQPGMPHELQHELQQQIAELQAAAAQNDAHIRELAGQLQRTVTALEQAAAQAEAQARRMERLCWTALAVSVTAIVVAIAAMLPA